MTDLTTLSDAELFAGMDAALDEWRWAWVNTFVAMCCEDDAEARRTLLERLDAALDEWRWAWVDTFVAMCAEDDAEARRTLLERLDAIASLTTGIEAKERACKQAQAAV